MNNHSYDKFEPSHNSFGWNKYLDEAINRNRSNQNSKIFKTIIQNTDNDYGNFDQDSDKATKFSAFNRSF